MGGDKKVVNTNTSAKTEEKKNADGRNVKTITTTIVETYEDGSTITKTQVQTITEGGTHQIAADGTKTEIPTDAKNKASKAELTTDEKFLQDALKAHNEYRAKHNTPPLTLNRELCKVAQAWANHQAKQQAMAHSSSGFGENCFWASYNVTDGRAPVDHWYNEIKQFNWSKVDHQKGTGHFTQVVWKDSKEFGIAKAVCKEGSTYVVANYDPAGNYLGQFEDNVLRPK